MCYYSIRILQQVCHFFPFFLAKSIFVEKKSTFFQKTPLCFREMLLFQLHSAVKLLFLVMKNFQIQNPATFAILLESCDCQVNVKKARFKCMIFQ